MTETIDTAALRELADGAIDHRNFHVWGPDGGTDLEGLTNRARKFVRATGPRVVLALLDRLAAAEARNATLTDDAARAERNRDMWRDQCAAQAQQIAQARAEAVQVKVLHETIIDAARRAMDEGEDALDTINVPSHHAAALSLALDDYDAAIPARAAASISTKGDGHAS